MGVIKAMTPKNITNKIITENGNFPNNSALPFLIYRHAVSINTDKPKELQDFLKSNGWNKSWVNSIYNYHHYHSNTHEVLVVFEGTATIEVGGNDGDLYEVTREDVIIIPVGVSHKKIAATDDFQVVGAYPFMIDYNMMFGTNEDYLKAKEEIKHVALPATDPIYGEQGYLFDYWKAVMEL